MNYDKSCQLLIIGDSSVGKTSILTRYTTGNFKEEYLATVGLDYFSKQELIKNKTIQIKIWDTAGQERYKALTPAYFKNAEGVLVVYDVTAIDSFYNLKFWINSIKTNMESKNIKIPIVLMGNKIDLEESREIRKEIAEKYATENNYIYFESSAKTGEGIDKAIRELVDQVINKKNNLDEQKEFRKDSVQIKEDSIENNNSSNKKRGCC